MPVKTTLQDAEYQRAYQAALAIARTAKKIQVTAGYFEDQITDRGEPLAMVAAVQEYGLPEANIPQRPFMAQAFNRNQRKYERFIREAIKNFRRHKTVMARMALDLGLHAAEDIQRAILTSKRWAEPLADSTIWKKGHDIPLQDSMQLAFEPTYRIEPADPNAPTTFKVPVPGRMTNLG